MLEGPVSFYQKTLEAYLENINWIENNQLSDGTNAISAIIDSQYLATEGDKVQFESLVKRLYIRHMFEVQELKDFDTNWNYCWKVSVGTSDDPKFENLSNVFNEYYSIIEL